MTFWTKLLSIYTLD